MDNSGGTSANIQASLAGRYATALFELAREAKAIDAVEKSMRAMAQAVTESADLKALTSNPVLSRLDAKKAIAAVAKAMKLDALTAKTLGVLADNRRLNETASVARAFSTLAAAHRGEVTAEVTSAHALSAAQTKAPRAAAPKPLIREGGAGPSRPSKPGQAARSMPSNTKPKPRKAAENQ